MGQLSILSQLLQGEEAARAGAGGGEAFQFFPSCCLPPVLAPGGGRVRPELSILSQLLPPHEAAASWGAQPHLSILSQLLLKTYATRQGESSGSFNSFPVAAHSLTLHVDYSRKVMSFQFFPSCCLSYRREWGQFFFSSKLSILSQLLQVVGVRQELDVHQVDLSILSQLLHGQSIDEVIKIIETSITFNSFPVAAWAWPHASLASLSAPFNSFPVAACAICYAIWLNAIRYLSILSQLLPWALSRGCL